MSYLNYNRLGGEVARLAIQGERIEQHIFKFVERELYNYPINKKLVASWERERQEMAGEIKSALSNLGDENSDRFAENKITNPTSAKAMRLVSMAGKVDRARWFIHAIDDVMGMLDEGDQQLVRLKYFKGYWTNAGVARELNMNRGTFYDRREGIIEKFGIRMGLL